MIFTLVAILPTLAELFGAVMFVSPIVVIGLAVYVLVIKPSWCSCEPDAHGFEVKITDQNSVTDKKEDSDHG